MIPFTASVFKLNQGEYVAAAHLESVYQGATCIETVYIHQNSSKSFLVAIVVPKRDWLIEMWQKEKGEKLEFNEICKQPAAVNWVLTAMFQMAQKDQVPLTFNSLHS